MIYFPARAEEYTILYILFFEKNKGGVPPLPCGDAGDNHHYQPHEQSNHEDCQEKSCPDGDRKETEPKGAREDAAGTEDDEDDGGEKAERAKSDATRSGGSLCSFVHCCYLLCFS